MTQAVRGTNCRRVSAVTGRIGRVGGSREGQVFDPFGAVEGIVGTRGRAWQGECRQEGEAEEETESEEDGVVARVMALPPVCA